MAVLATRRPYKRKPDDPLGRAPVKDWVKKYFLSDKYLPTIIPAIQLQIKDYELQHIDIDLGYFGLRPLYGVQNAKF